MVRKNKNKNTTINIGTLNCRSLQNKLKKIDIANDFIKYKLFAITTQETRLKGQSAETLTSTNSKKLIHYYSGNPDNTKNGVGIILEEQTPAIFTPINDRLCMVKIKQNKNRQNIVIIAAYAPHSQLCKDKPEIKDKFYEELHQLTQTVSKRDILVIAGDMNAKTGSGHKEHPKIIGKFGKGKMNENGNELIEFCIENDMILTNTLFQHKMSHRTTWEMPEKPNSKDKNGEPRRNPYRNQIDYIIVKRRHVNAVTDSRSYQNIATQTDHRLVIMNIRSKSLTSYYKKTKHEKPINYERIHQLKYQKQYHDRVKEKLNEIEKPVDIQQQWDRITNINKETAIEIFGRKENIDKKKNESLSTEQKQFRNKIES